MSMKQEQEKMYGTRLVALAEAKVIDLLPQGDHGFRVFCGGRTVDYWPGTGSWRTPTGSMSGKGYQSLLAFLDVKEP